MGFEDVNAVIEEVMDVRVDDSITEASGGCRHCTMRNGQHQSNCPNAR